MADDSFDIEPEEFKFYPLDSPRGMLWFNKNLLPPIQQQLLNDLKIDMMIENNQYLAKHPEIRAIISIFVKAVIHEKPVTKPISEFAVKFFSMTEDQLLSKINTYLQDQGEPLEKEGDSAVNLAVQPHISRSSIDDLASLYHHGFYTYVSYTDEGKTYEEEEWSEYFGEMASYTTQSDYGRRFDMLFASRASFEEGLEESTISLTKQYMDLYSYGIPSDKNIAEEETRKSLVESFPSEGSAYEEYGTEATEPEGKEYGQELEEEAEQYDEEEVKEEFEQENKLEVE